MRPEPELDKIFEEIMRKKRAKLDTPRSTEEQKQKNKEDLTRVIKTMPQHVTHSEENKLMAKKGFKNCSTN